MSHKTPIVGLALLILAATPSLGGDRALRAELELPAPIDAVWAAWTTSEGISSFFAPAAHIDLRVDGAYDIYFDPAAEPGQRGAEGMRILALEPQRRLAFTWNAPVAHHYVRGQRTQVVLEFASVDTNRTKLRFTHLGWGEGEAWDAAYEYFDRAWNEAVLPRLAYRFAYGPIDWDDRPSVEPLAESMRVDLVTRSR